MFQAAVLSESCPEVEPGRREVMPVSGEVTDSGKDTKVYTETNNRGALALVAVVVTSDVVVVIGLLSFLIQLFR